MAKINYHGRKFRGVSNTPDGQVSEDTLFCYFQSDDKLTATYSGGSIKEGHMLGRVLPDNSLEFVYHHLDIQGILKSGHCISRPEILDNGSVQLHESWQWTSGGEGHGASVIKECK